MKAGIGLLFHIGSFPAKVSGIYSAEEGFLLDGEICLEGSPGFREMLEQLAKAMGITVNLWMLPEINVENIWFTYVQKPETMGFGLKISEKDNELGTIRLLSGGSEGTAVSFRYEKPFLLTDIPIAGDWLSGLGGSGIGPLALTFESGGRSRLRANLKIGDSLTELKIPLGSSRGDHRENSLYPSVRAEEGTGPVHWIDCKKSLGCLTFLAMGGAFTDGCLYLMIKAECSLGIMTVSLEGLGVMVPFPNLTDVRPVLTGLGLSVKNSFMELSGSFAKELGRPSYSGKIVVRVKTFSFTLAGGFTQTPYTSVFAVGVVKAKIGIASCIVITGIAAGFGYNRRLQVPDIDHLDQFVLMKIIKGQMSPEDASRNMPPERGSHWLAAGLQFTAYNMIKGDAIASLQFGNHLQVDITGKAVLDLSLGSGALLAHVLLLVKASFQPEYDLISIEAALGGESYLLSKSCQITGGFAFYLWYGGGNKGDFVMTIGGYHRDYKKPGHYPSVQPLALKWQITKDIVVQGNIYFALTPSCLMAGGSLQLLFDAGWVRAWCSARVDILLQWRPFYYDFYIEVSLGISVKIIFKRVSLEIGCSLHLWGPEFSGIARIRLWIISFDIKFIDSDPNSVRTIDWEEFEKEYLPLEQKRSDGSGSFQACQIQIAGGMLSEASGGKWNVRADGLDILISTKMPFISWQLNDGQADKESNPNLGIYPCGEETLDAFLHITLSGNMSVDLISLQKEKSSLPCALWGNKTMQDREDQWKRETVEANTGIRLKMKGLEYETTQVMIETKVGQGEPGEKIRAPYIEGKNYGEKLSFDAIRETIDKEEISEKRRNLFHAMGMDQLPEFGTVWGEPGKLEEIFREPPCLRTLGGRYEN